MIRETGQKEIYLSREVVVDLNEAIGQAALEARVNLPPVVAINTQERTVDYCDITYCPF